MSNDLITTVHDLVLESPIGAKAIAQAVGKPYSTLLREVSPYDTNPVGRILDLYSAAGGRLRAALPKDSKGLERFLNGVDNASGR